MNWKDIITIYLTDNYSLSIEFGPAILVVVLIIVAILIIKLLTKQNWGLRHDIELNINLGGIGNVRIKPNHELEQIAHKAWTELITRKAGLQFDLEHDVIVEVYNSWYVLFGEIRNLVKEIPAEKIKDENTQKLVNLLVDSLNKGLRPHLTKWQARFRKWYEHETKEHDDKTPQEIQKMYPLYGDLIQDLVVINQQMVAYTNELKKLLC